jgi:hypothetical protein
MHVAEQNRLGTAPHVVARQIGEHLRWLEKRITDSEKEPRRRLMETAVWREQDELVRMLLGVATFVASLFGIAA